MAESTAARVKSLREELDRVRMLEETLRGYGEPYGFDPSEDLRRRLREILRELLALHQACMDAAVEWSGPDPTEKKAIGWRQVLANLIAFRSQDRVNEKARLQD